MMLIRARMFQNIQLSIEIPQKFDEQDVLCILNYSSLIKLGVEVPIAGGDSNVLNWFHVVNQSVATPCFQVIISYIPWKAMLHSGASWFYENKKWLGHNKSVKIQLYNYLTN